jgi:hypothetical protein
MNQKRTKWDNPAEHAVLVKLHHGYRLTRKDHFTLAKIYEVHGPSSVYMAMGNLSGSLPHMGKGLEQAAKERGSRKKSTRLA